MATAPHRIKNDSTNVFVAFDNLDSSWFDTSRYLSVAIDPPWRRRRRSLFRIVHARGAIFLQEEEEEEEEEFT